MAKVAIGFSWRRAASGYRLIGPDDSHNIGLIGGLQDGIPEEGFIMGFREIMGVDRFREHLEKPQWRSSQRIIPNLPCGQIEKYEPLERFPRLFAYFASIPKTPEGLLDFVNKYGPLSHYGAFVHDDPKSVKWGGDVVEYFLDMARIMEQMLSSPDLKKDVPVAGVAAKLSPDPIDGSVRLKLEVDNLASALWLQCAQHLSSGTNLRRCQRCNTWFEVGIGTGRRLDAKFCSDEHRILFNSRRRSERVA
jgi:hypothetical protein